MGSEVCNLLCKIGPFDQYRYSGWSEKNVEFIEVVKYAVESMKYVKI